MLFFCVHISGILYLFLYSLLDAISRHILWLIGIVISSLHLSSSNCYSLSPSRTQTSVCFNSTVESFMQWSSYCRTILPLQYYYFWVIALDSHYSQTQEIPLIEFSIPNILVILVCLNVNKFIWIGLEINKNLMASVSGDTTSILFVLRWYCSMMLGYNVMREKNNDIHCHILCVWILIDSYLMLLSSV